MRAHLRFLTRGPQTACSCCCAITLGVISIICLVSAASTTEKILSYSWSSRPTLLEFTLDDDLEGDTILLWYDIPELYVNQKRYIENKESEIWSNLFSKYHCDDAKTLRDFEFRRSGDIEFLSRVATSAGTRSKVHPCGLVAMSMFTDEFELMRIEQGRTVRVPLNENDLALPNEDKVYEGVLLEHPRPFPERYSIRSHPERSWLRDARDLEHFMVWMRTPPAPHVRHLWATIDGPLEAGSYIVNVTVNSPVWTETWKVPEKRLVFSESRALGSKGAAEFLGVLAALLAAIEVLMTILTLVVPAAERKPM
mmetsp:Transcript_64402/g.119759  ORF Transcript_64402/g.119759 Transcript_64402/m.119759 type:complete len:310 (-) Transcript_64402:122-1051(-)